MGNIVLTGFMGTGKTAVGREVARRLGWRFIDTDRLVEEAAGMSVAEIFARDGEASFRARERQAIAEACAVQDAVVATGGGALADPVNRERLRAAGTIVCLDADVETVLGRIGDDTTRPLLRSGAHGDVRARVRALMAEREPVYATADHRVDTSGRSVAAVADAVLQVLPGRGAS
jgi:shikimate kinase